MAETTIEWADYTFNPWIGCTRVATGCTHCYAESYANRYGKAKWGPGGTRAKTSEANWKLPLKWNKKAAAEGVRPRVFCASLADVFEDWGGQIVDYNGVQLWRGWDHGATIPATVRPSPRSSPLTMTDLRRELFALIDATPHLDWLLLTKRPENITRMLPAVTIGSQQQADDCNERGELYRRNVWLLTSVAEQKDADTNLPHLLACRDLAPVLGVSAEPLVGPVDLTQVGGPDSVRLENANRPLLRINALRGCTDPASNLCGAESLGRLDWVIVGGESGPGARPMHPDWARSLRDQCADAGVPFLFKQWGEWAPNPTCDCTCVRGELCSHGDKPNRGGRLCDDEHVLARVGKKAAGRLLDGVTHDGFPEPSPAALKE